MTGVHGSQEKATGYPPMNKTRGDDACRTQLEHLLAIPSNFSPNYHFLGVQHKFFNLVLLKAEY